MSIALADLRFVVFDLETTGLDADRGDEMVEIGALKVEGKTILEDQSFQSLVKPQKKMSKEAVKVHGISEKELEHAPRVEEVLPKFLSFAGNNVLVAQNAGFDLSFVCRDMYQLHLGSIQNPVLDTMLLSRFLFSYEKRHNLDAITARLNIRNEWDRHRSLGDCWLTAKVLIEMIGILERRGHGTLASIESCLQKPPPPPAHEPQETLALF